MSVIEVIKKRRSIRRYRPARISDEDLRSILEAARLAPSAGNRQPWYFIVVREKSTKERLAEAAAHQMFIADADVIIVGISDPNRSPRWYDKDIMIAMEHMVLVATELGYGTCWIGAFDEDKVKDILGIPEEYRVIALLPVGVPAESPEPRPRRSLEEIAFSEKWGNRLAV